MIKRLFRSLFFSGSPFQVMLEMIGISLLLLALFHNLADSLVPFVFGNGALFLCAACGAWAVLRTRFYQHIWPYRLAYEVGLATSVSVIMAVGINQISLWLGWRELWVSFWGNPDSTTLLLGWIGPGCFFCRVLIWFYSFWNHLQRKHLIWSLTNAHLKVVLWVSFFVCLFLFWISPFAQTALQTAPVKPDLMAFATTRILLTVFPSIYLYVFSTLFALIVIMPLSTLFSFLFFRKTTRRLDDLIHTTRALRDGDYQARAQVTGEDEVTHLQNDFNMMAAELQKTLQDLQKEKDTVARLLQQRSEMIAAVSHELRTPLAVVRSRLENNLESQELTVSNGLERDLKVSYQEILRLQALIDDLFLLARSEASVLPVTCHPVDIQPLAAQVVEALRQSAWNSRKVEIILESPDQKAVANVDAQRVKQILVNLLRNSINHTLPGGAIIVSTRIESGQVCLWVRDTGSGISAEDLPHIWDRFYRGSHENNADGGTGLGLALVKELTEAMGGSVAVQSQLGQGSSFEVYFSR